MTKAQPASMGMVARIGIGLVVATAWAIFSVLYAWPVMVALGVLHGQWRVVPAFGFWQVGIVLLAIRLVTPRQTQLTDRAAP